MGYDRGDIVYPIKISDCSFMGDKRQQNLNPVNKKKMDVNKEELTHGETW